MIVTKPSMRVGIGCTKSGISYFTTTSCVPTPWIPTSRAPVTKGT